MAHPGGKNGVGAKAMIQALPIPVMAIDRDFNVLQLNEIGAGFVGLTPEQAEGRKCYDLFKTDHCQTPNCALYRAMQSGQPCTAETIAHGGATPTPIEYSGAPLRNEAGDVVGAVEFVMDVSARKRIVHSIREAAESMAENDLTVRLDENLAGDYGAIAKSLNRAIIAQHDSFSVVAEAVGELMSVSEQIAASSQEVANGATTQSAALQQTSAGLEEMSGMTQQSAEHTRHANTLAQTAHTAAESGNSAMSQMDGAMDRIRGAATSTAEIIRDINEIAFQTNLLALNAAVEAARAGDAGRGFAVVAEEVRNLAQRAKEAAQKTEELIKESASLAEEGSTLSRTVGGHLNEIVGSVREVSGIVAEISAASQEQAQGIQQISAAMQDVDSATQRAAASAEQSAGASEELHNRTAQLAEQVEQYVLADVQSARTPRGRPRGLPSRTNGRGRNGVNRRRQQRPASNHRKAAELIPFDEDDTDFKDF